VEKKADLRQFIVDWKDIGYELIEEYPRNGK